MEMIFFLVLSYYKGKSVILLYYYLFFNQGYEFNIVINCMIVYDNEYFRQLGQKLNFCLLGVCFFNLLYNLIVF